MDPKDPFTSDIRRRVGAREAAMYADPLRKMVLAMPEMLGHIRQWTEEPGEEGQLGRLHAFALAYMYNPTDFLPEKTHGLFGYVDDAYLVAGVYERTMHQVDWAGVKPYVDHPVLAQAVPGWLETTRRLLPEVTSRIDMILDNLMEDRDAGAKQ